MTDISTDPAAPAVRENNGAAPAPKIARASAGRRRAWWSAPAGVVGAITGLAPHVLHHIGLLAGTALITGAGGTFLFGVLGLAMSVPLLLRLRRRFNTWWAPVIGLATFAVMFSVSAFIIGPAINGGAGVPPGGGQPAPSVEHSGHHG